MLRKPGSLTAVAASIAALVAPAAHAEWALNMTRGVTDISRDVYSLHMTILWWCVAIAVFVFGWMIVSLVKFRKSKGAIPDTAMVHSTKAEIIWTVIPIVILVILAVPSARTLISIEDASKTELTIKATGYQWKWGYDYLDKGVSFYSTLSADSNEARQMNSGSDVHAVKNYLLSVDNPVVVPVGTKVRLLVTAQDVIHAWWVPALAIKKDAIPGFVNELWFQIDADKPGEYRGQCTELCGRDHGFMPIVVKAVSKEEFAAWLKAKQDEQKQASLPAAPTAG